MIWGIGCSSLVLAGRLMRRFLKRGDHEADACGPHVWELGPFSPHTPSPAVYTKLHNKNIDQDNLEKLLIFILFVLYSIVCTHMLMQYTPNFSQQYTQFENHFESTGTTP